MLFAHSHDPGYVAQMMVEDVYHSLFMGDPSTKEDLITYLVIFSIYFFFKVLICGFLYKQLKTIPKLHRRIKPGMVWLILVPFLTSLVFNFMVYPQVSKSLKRFADALQNHSVEDCGETLAWLYCGFNLLNLILLFTFALFGIPVGFLAFFFLLAFLFRVSSVANQLKAGVGPDS